ncbi:MAG: ATP-binding protein [Polyangiales bacterium]
MGEPLYGRDEELRKLAAALEEAKAGRGRLFVLAGEPGIGKTRLCDELAHIAQTSSFEVAWGRCWETEGGAPAYLPWAELLRTIGGERRAELAAILPEIGAPPEAGEDARFRLFSAVSGTLARAAESVPLLLIVDDAHAADLPSLSILHFVARALRQMRVLLVVTMRDVAARPPAQAAALLHKIGREGERLQLRRLSLFDVERWVGARSATAASDIHRLSEGNPLFVAELLRLDDARVPNEVHAALAAHLAMLSEVARGALGIAAVFGRTFLPSDVAGLCGLDGDAMDAIVSEAVRLGVVVPRGGEIAFGHVLLRDELYASIPPSRRAELHWKIGQRLAEQPASIAAAAFHLARGVSAGNPAFAREVTRRAARSAMAVLAFEDAVELLVRARDELEGTDLDRLELSVEIARTQMHAGELALGRQGAVECAARARAISAPEWEAESALVYGAEIAGGQVDPVMVRLLRDSLVALPHGDSRLRARVLARLASAIVPGDDQAQNEAVSLADEAMKMADRLDHFETTYAVIQWAAPAYGFALPLRERAPLIKRLLSLAQQAGDVVGELRARQMDLIVRFEDGDGESAVAELCRKVEQLARPFHAWRAPQARGTLAVARGRFAEAEECAREVRALGTAAGVHWIAAMYSALVVATLDARDDIRGFAEFVRAEEITLRNAPSHQWFFAFLHARAGNIEEARAWIEKATAHLSIVHALPSPVLEACARTGNRALGEPIYTMLAAREERSPFTWGPSGAFSLGPTALPLGNLAVALGRDEEAISWYERAIARCGRAGFPGHHARTERELADVLERRGDVARAASLRASAIARAEALGMHDFVARMRASTAPKKEAPSASLDLAIEREGDVWRVAGFGALVRIKDGKGIRYLERLVRERGRELHVLDLVGAEDEGDAGPALDDRAKAAYRSRLEDLRDALAEAEKFGDSDRAARARGEIDAIADELARGVGLGGRDRKAASTTERARINVQRRLKDVLDRIEAQAPALGRRLAASIQTGTYCSFVPV